MATKVKEIVANPNGDRRRCPICNPPADKVPMDKVWTWALEHPGESVWR